MAEQNYLTYVKNDEGGANLTISAGEIVFVDLDRNEDDYVSKDFGVDFFEDIDVLGSFIVTSHMSGGLVGVFGLCQVPSDMVVMFGDDALILRTWHSGTTENFELIYINGGSFLIVERFLSFLVNTRYWWRLTRIGSTITVYLYDDEARSSLITTLTGTGDTNKLRYHEPLFAYNDAQTPAVATGTVYGTDFQEVPAFQAAWARNSNQLIGVS